MGTALGTGGMAGCGPGGQCVGVEDMVAGSRCGCRDLDGLHGDWTDGMTCDSIADEKVGDEFW